MASGTIAVRDVESTVRSLQQLPVESWLKPVIIQIVIIIVTARVFAVLARKLGQPSAIGEIVAGILLGPTLLGWLYPEFWGMIFHPKFPGISMGISNVVFNRIFEVISQIGLILLMFQVGLDTEVRHLKNRGLSAVAVLLSGILIPFALGMGLGYFIHAKFIVPVPVSRMGMMLFLGVAMSITAMPILARILSELGIQRTHIGTLTMTAAAGNDALGWILLSAVAAVVRSQFDPLETLLVLAEATAFVLVMVGFVRPVLTRYFDWEYRRNKGDLNLTGVTVVLAVLFVAALATEYIGVFTVFGAFVLGATLSGHEALRTSMTNKLQDIVNCFFLPIFFTYTGLKTDLNTLTSEGGTSWWVLAAVLIVAMLGKIGGCFLAARLSGFGNRESSIIGILMNTRGLMELIVINVGYELGVVPEALYSMLVLMAILSTVMTTPFIVGLRKGTELEKPIEESGFLKRSWQLTE